VAASIQAHSNHVTQPSISKSSLFFENLLFNVHPITITTTTTTTTTSFFSAMRRSRHPRATHTSLAISNSISCPESFTSSSSPELQFHKARRPSVSSTMHWLTRTSSSPAVYAASKPVRISEPKLVRSIDILSRTGTALGSGATVVRTPDQALRETGVRVTYEPPDSKEERSVEPVVDKVTSSPIQQAHPPANELLSPPTSPPLPPLPLPDIAEEKILSQESAKTPPPRPTRTPPLIPASQSPSRRSSLKSKLVHVSQDAPAVPEVPPHFVASVQPPPFSAILISDPPSVKVDSSTTIVSLETCTTTYRTTVNTINSRPSHLSDFISSLYEQREPKSDDASSMYSMSSEDMTAYHCHLTSQGLFPRSTTIHLFLDRPSAP
jgi:hypothetical protein